MARELASPITPSPAVYGWDIDYFEIGDVNTAPWGIVLVRWLGAVPEEGEREVVATERVRISTEDIQSAMAAAPQGSNVYEVVQAALVGAVLGKTSEVTGQAFSLS